MKLTDRQINHIAERIKVAIAMDDHWIEEVIWGEAQNYRAIVTYWQERLQDDSHECLNTAKTASLDDIINELLEKQTESIAETIYDELAVIEEDYGAISVLGE